MRYDLVVFAALDREVTDLEKSLSRVVSDGCFALYAGHLGSADLLLVRTGLGPANAREAAERVFARAETGAALSLGTCGGLVDGLVPGELVIADRVVDAGNGKTYAMTPDLRPLIHEAARAAPRRRIASIASADHILASPQEKQALAERTGAAAVDMESAALAHACEARKVPFAAVRAVLDLAGEALPRHPEGPLMDDAGRPHWSRLLAVAARDPMLPMGLTRLWRRERATRFALSSFVRALCAEARREAS
jgi:nucleoside phosphorylase